VTERRFAELDGLRGLAALAIVAGHLWFAKMPIAFDLPFGSRVAVWVFFVLSSFLLTIQSLADAKDNRLGWTVRYFIRRVFRIYPLFMVCIGVDIVTGRMPGDDAFRLLTLTKPCCEYIYWAIRPEFIFYFLIPLIGLIALRFPRFTTAALGAISCASIAFGRHYDVYSFLSTFVFGSIAAIIFLNWPKLSVTLSGMWPLALGVAVLSGVSPMTVAGHTILPVDWNGMHGAIWASVILACAHGEKLLSWLSARPLRYLGSISFSVYLTHPWLIALAERLGFAGRPYSGIIVFTSVLLFASLTFQLIEKPSVRFGRLFENRLLRKQRADVPETSAAVAVSESAAQAADPIDANSRSRTRMVASSAEGRDRTEDRSTSITSHARQCQNRIKVSHSLTPNDGRHHFLTEVFQHGVVESPRPTTSSASHSHRPKP
jgi:peptidoglycan/LPS O-acetylase OafA/YrhL